MRVTSGDHTHKWPLPLVAALSCCLLTGLLQWLHPVGAHDLSQVELAHELQLEPNANITLIKDFQLTVGHLEELVPLLANEEIDRAKQLIGTMPLARVFKCLHIIKSGSWRSFPDELFPFGCCILTPMRLAVPTCRYREPAGANNTATARPNHPQPSSTGQPASKTTTKRPAEAATTTTTTTAGGALATSTTSKPHGAGSSTTSARPAPASSRSAPATLALGPPLISMDEPEAREPAAPKKSASGRRKSHRAARADKHSKPAASRAGSPSGARQHHAALTTSGPDAEDTPSSEASPAGAPLDSEPGEVTASPDRR